MSHFKENIASCDQNRTVVFMKCTPYSLNAELRINCHLLALLGAHPILHFSRIRVNEICIFSRGFRKNLKYQTLRESVQWELSGSMRTDRQTDGET